MLTHGPPPAQQHPDSGAERVDIGGLEGDPRGDGGTSDRSAQLSLYYRHIVLTIAMSLLSSKSPLRLSSRRIPPYFRLWGIAFMPYHRERLTNGSVKKAHLERRPAERKASQKARDERGRWPISSTRTAPASQHQHCDDTTPHPDHGPLPGRRTHPTGPRSSLSSRRNAPTHATPHGPPPPHRPRPPPSTGPPSSHRYSPTMLVNLLIRSFCLLPSIIPGQKVTRTPFTHPPPPHHEQSGLGGGHAITYKLRYCLDVFGSWSSPCLCVDAPSTLLWGRWRETLKAQVRALSKHIGETTIG